MKILILDMDGTIRIKKGAAPGDIKAGFISHPEDQDIIPGAAKAIESYYQQGWLIIGASNQGGVAAGKKTLESCFEEQQYTLKLVPELYKIYFCPDYEGNLLGSVRNDGIQNFASQTELGLLNFPSFRKPSHGMIEAIRLFYGWNKVLFVGDRTEDEQAAAKAEINFQWAKDWWEEQP